MKKLIYAIIVIVALGLIVAGCTTSVVPPAEQSVADDKGKPTKCTTIQSGELVASDGTVITTGYDKWGYNYQAHLFNGFYCDSYRDAAWCQPYKDVELMMKWNDAWISNKDCDGDGLLDRHYGFVSYIGSGAWLTNHQSGEYEEDGEICKWNYFVKIVAAPADATKVNDIWYNADGIEIGPDIWGQFAIVQQVENDACAGLHGLQYKSPAGPGFGQYIPHIPQIEFVETVEVPGTNEYGVDSFYDLENGKDYLLRASGTYRFASWSGDFGLADAEYSNRTAIYTPDNADGWIKGEGYFTSVCGLNCPR